MHQNRFFYLALFFFALATSGCTVNLQTKATSIPDLEIKPTSIFVVSNTPNLDKYMDDVGRKTTVRIVKVLQDRGISAWSYDQGALDLERKTVDDSLMICNPEAVLVIVEKIGLVSKSWGLTSVKEFEIESRLLMADSEKVVWQARTTGNIQGDPSLRDTHRKLAAQIIGKLEAKNIVPGHQSGSEK